MPRYRVTRHPGELSGKEWLVFESDDLDAAVRVFKRRSRALHEGGLQLKDGYKVIRNQWAPSIRVRKEK